MNEQFGNRLINLRKQKGLSQEDLGNLIGVSRQTISKWELDMTTPELEKLIALGNVFEMSIDALVGNESANNLTSSRPRFHYEYKSKIMIGNRPLVHINIGQGLYKARGIISIGMFASGVLSLGVFSCGIISFGAISLGIISLAAFALGLYIAVGDYANGHIAIDTSLNSISTEEIKSGIMREYPSIANWLLKFLIS